MPQITRMHEQLKALWKTRDDQQPFVKGVLLTRNKSKDSDGAAEGSNEGCSELLERWFTLLGHVLFFCKSRDSPEYSGALLTDLFSPVLARVDEKTFSSFGLPEADQVSYMAS